MRTSRAVRLLRALALAGMGLLTLATVFAALYTADSSAGLWAMLLALSLPLLLPLPGMVRGRRRTYAWATLCLLPGLVYGLTEVVANPAARLPAAVVLFLCVIEFVVLVAFLRATRPGHELSPD